MNRLFTQIFGSVNYSFAIFIGIIVLVFAIYFDGIIYSTFLLDDFVNFKNLSNIQDNTDIEGILGYALNGVSGASGRPLSLFTFAFQAHAWPEHAFYFKLVNFALHIINGYLVYCLVMEVIKLRPFQAGGPGANHLALIGAFIWLIHPVQVSTVLYSVQRMTELSSLFVLGGMLAYLHGRKLFSYDNRSIKGYLYITAGIIIGGFIGILAKENAILLCLYIIVIESCLFSGKTFYRQKEWSLLFLYLPLLLLLTYLVIKSFPYIITEYPLRTFSASERLLTEFKVVRDYILLFFLPRPIQLGLFHTDYTIVKSIFDTQFLAAFIWISFLILLALFSRKNHPVFSFGLLFFFSAHALESTFLNLELYFEHRNYLAIIGLILSMLYLLTRITTAHRTTAIFKYTLTGLFIIWTGILATITYKEVNLWSRPLIQAETWYAFNKESDRARINYNFLLTMFGNYNQTYENYREIFFSDINSPGEALMWVQLRCFDESIPYPPHDLMLQKLSQGIFSNAVFASLDDIAIYKSKGECNGLDNQIIYEYIEAVSESRHYQRPHMQRTLQIIKSKYLINEGRYKEALQTTLSADQVKSTADTMINIVYLHYMLGDSNQTKHALESLENYCQKSPVNCIKFNNDIRTLKKTVAN